MTAASDRPSRLDARALRDLVLDPGSWRSWDSPIPPRDGRRGVRPRAGPGRSEKTRQDESIITGEGLLRGRRVAVVAGEFGFLAGSIGVAAAERLIAAVERATDEGLPLLAAPVSGGTRMQEGTVAFLQMIGITAAIARHKQAGLPYLVYLRNPTFGGVLASWGSLGHVTIAEPGASIGFLGPRVFEALYGEPFPEGVQTAENMAEHGLIDAVVPHEEIAEVADRALRVLAARPDLARRRRLGRPAHGRGRHRRRRPRGAGRTAWDVVTASRRADRPGVRRLLRTAATDVVGLSGTGAGEKDPGLLLALARFGGAPCVVLGQDRRGQSTAAPLGPAALREARRGMHLAQELRLPLVTLIDTPGAALSREAEEGGLAGEIARCLGTRTRLIGRERGYHGVGFGGMSVGGMVANRRAFATHLPGVDHIRHTHDLTRNAFAKDQPEHGAELADDLERMVALHGADTIAAVIVEPVPGSTAVLPPPKGYLKRLRELCDKHGILLIFDEVITGFGRLGAPFAADYFGVTPDMMTTAKGITNGTVPCGAVFASRKIHDGLMNGPEGTIELFHGYTYSAHPVACAAGIATLDIYKDEGLLTRGASLAEYWGDALHSLKGLPNVIDIRNVGLMGAVELSPRSDGVGARGYDVMVDCFNRGLYFRMSGGIPLRCLRP